MLDYLGRFEEAETSTRTALRLRPEDAVAHRNLGYILYHLGRATEAQASYRAALRLRSERPEYHMSLGLALLMAGQFEEGWKEFEWRWQTELMTSRGPLFPVPSWNGETIGDRVILLLSDQGQGDTLQFCRYVPRVAAGARRTILAVQPSLVRLMSRLPGVSEIITQDVQPSSFDLWCALMSLPYAVGTTPETIPATPYLTADPADVTRWRERLTGLTGLRVELCWAGERSPNMSKIVVDRRRSVSLATLAPFGEISGVQFISLQKGPPAAEAACPPQGMQFHDFTDDLHDFADTAALIESSRSRHQRRYGGCASGRCTRQTGLAIEPFRHLLALAPKPGRQSLVSVAAPVSPTHARRLAQRDQPRARRPAAPCCGRPQSITATGANPLIARL